MMFPSQPLVGKATGASFHRAASRERGTGPPSFPFEGEVPVETICIHHAGNHCLESRKPGNPGYGAGDRGAFQV